MNNNLIKSLVTIAIPAYKKQFLKEAIMSALNQTYDNLELIIVNDHSPDNLDEIVNEFDDKRIRYYKNERNLGKESIVYNWNKCLSLATGEFFVLLCDDDIMMPDFISDMLRLTEKYPECDVFKSRTILFNGLTNTIINESLIWPEYERYEDLLENSLKGLRRHTITEFLYRTSVIKKIGGYKIYPCGFYADSASILNLVKGKGIVSSENINIIYRKSQYNITTLNKYNVEKAHAAILYYKWLMKMLPQQGKYKELLYQNINFDLYKYVETANSLKDRFRILILTLSLISIRIKDLKSLIYCMFRRSCLKFAV